MPQEASLTGSLTIMETFTYYGSLNGVPSHEIISKVETLRTIMNLPNLNSRTNQISGGEQRRVSLCVALLHDPEILLLDEPTTGIDPLLRERIWDYLRLLVESKGTTVFVTTHYVHETRQCKQIGYLRDGSMLVQDSPSMLLDKYGPNCNLNTASLDDVILHLCKIPRSLRTTPRKSTPAVKFSQVRKEPDLDQNVEILSFKSVKDDFINMSGEPIKQKFDPRLVSRKYAASKKYCVQVKALAIRNVIIYMRFISYPMLQLVVILINMLIGLYALGYNPKGLNLGAIMDNGQIHCDTNFAHQISSVCNATNSETDYTCRLLNIVQNLGVDWAPLSTELEAVQAIRAGSINGYIKFPKNFTENVIKRLIWNIHSDEEILNGSTISITLDNSDYMNTYFLTTSLYESVHEFLVSSANESDVGEWLVTLPLKVSPIYGSQFYPFNAFLVPTFVLVLWTFMSTTLGVVHILDRGDNTFARTIATGVEFGQIQLGYYLADIPLAIFQAGLILLMIWWDRGEQIKGSWALIGLIFYLARVAVIALYFILASFNVNVKDSTLLMISIVMVYVYASDTIWPIEAVVWWYRPFCHCLPMTVTIRVLRSVITRGWGITHPTVFFGGICFPLIITGISTIVSFVVEKSNKK
ncbi:ABC transporter G family member 23 isoform X2 [Folsomia candida]|nr:ABC transporter G family member 23 isoform X2 [Folsomia candida]XP_035701382.1 ABC transporter G family member 23 isoform X2 [Folsomia candida]